MVSRETFPIHDHKLNFVNGEQWAMYRWTAATVSGEHVRRDKFKLTCSRLGRRLAALSKYEGERFPRLHLKLTSEAQKTYFDQYSTVSCDNSQPSNVRCRSLECLGFRGASSESGSRCSPIMETYSKLGASEMMSL